MTTHPYLLPPQAPSMKSQGHLNVPETGLSLPYTFITGREPGPNILITAGVHGSEYPAIETAKQLAYTLKPDNLKGSVLILPLLNQSAFRLYLRAVMAEDGNNLNRMFPGDPEGSTSQRLAHFLLHQLMMPADFYIDMHGGDLAEDLTPLVFYPTKADPSVTEVAKAAAIASGFPYLIASRSISGAYNSAAAHGTPALLTELGHYGLWDQAQVDQYTEKIRRLLTHLGVLDEAVPPVTESYTLCSAVNELEAGLDGFWYPAFTVGDSIQAGDLVGEIKDAFGQSLAKYHAPVSGRLLYQTISLSVQKDMFLAAIAEVLAHDEQQ